MKTTHSTPLNDDETIRTVDMIAEAPLPKHGAAHGHAIYLAILLLAALVAIGIAYADGNVAQWTSQSDDFRLTYLNDHPVLRIEAYACNLTGSVAVDLRGTTKIHRVTGSSGGRCDVFLGGRLEIDMQSNPQLIRVFGQGNAREKGRQQA
jgi:hypothetical protein